MIPAEGISAEDLTRTYQGLLASDEMRNQFAVLLDLNSRYDAERDVLLPLGRDLSVGDVDYTRPETQFYEPSAPTFFPWLLPASLSVGDISSSKDCEPCGIGHTSQETLEGASLESNQRVKTSGFLSLVDPLRSLKAPSNNTTPPTMSVTTNFQLLKGASVESNEQHNISDFPSPVYPSWFPAASPSSTTAPAWSITTNTGYYPQKSGKEASINQRTQQPSPKFTFSTLTPSTPQLPAMELHSKIRKNSAPFISINSKQREGLVPRGGGGGNSRPLPSEAELRFMISPQGISIERLSSMYKHCVDCDEKKREFMKLVRGISQYDKERNLLLPLPACDAAKTSCDFQTQLGGAL